MKKVISALTLLFLVTLGFSQVKVGDKAPGFSLKNVDGSTVSLNNYKDKKGVIVVFTCNHCPYSKAYEDRLIQLQKKHGSDYPIVAINPNDASTYPSDSYDNMKVRAKEKGFNFAYIRDDSQSVAKAYGAKKTPHVYLLENNKGHFHVAYIGAIDDNYAEESKVKTHYLEDAIEALQKGEKIKTNKTVAVGCSVKWKS